MNEKQLNRWEMVRFDGKRRYIFRFGGLFIGLLGYGLLGQIFVIKADYLYHNLSFSFFDGKFLFDLIVRLIIAFPMGCAVAWVMWKFNEWDYLKTKRKQK